MPKPLRNVAVRQPVKLQVEIGEQTDEAVWVEVARSGTYKGHPAFPEGFTFTRETFESVIANLHNHPSFEAGADGVGTADVIPWDFNHASEESPTSGSLPVAGAPAQAWTRDFQIRDNPDGTVSLMALTRFLEPLRSHIRAGRYKWASIVLWFDTRDPVSGESTGPIVSSIAATNTPFIESLEPLAASRHYYFEAAKDAEDALGMVRQLFGLPETIDAIGVLSEVRKLQGWIESGEVPLGVDAEGLLGGLRQILNLPALAEVAEVFAQTDQILASLLNGGVGAGSPDEPSGSEPSAEAAITSKETEMTISKILASKLGVKESDDAVTAAVASLIDLRDGLVGAFKLDPNLSDKAVCDKVSDLAGVQTKLQALLGALGVENADAAVEKITDMLQRTQKLEEIMPELKSLREASEQRAEEEATSDAEAAIASHFGGNKDHLPVVLLYRKNVGREKFRERYPAVEPDKAHLSKTLAAGPEGGGEPPAKPRAEDKGGEVIDLSKYPSDLNRTQRMLLHLKQELGTAWDDLDRDTQFRMAWERLHTHKIVGA